MPKKIAIASGKGGTGKTTVSVSLSKYLQRYTGQEIYLIDCDVEEPNDLLFFPQAEKVREENVQQWIPSIDSSKCTYCSKCASYCEFNAITIVALHKYAKVDKGMCHSCGACLVACDDDAIVENPEIIGSLGFYTTSEKTHLVEGRLKIGSPMQTMLIKALKKQVPENAEMVIYDAPPGTSCSVVETVSDVDYVILVAEPTLFGLHDLKLMVELLRKLKVPFGLVINKAGLGDDDIYQYISEENIPLLGEIPFSKDYASLYAKGMINSDAVTSEIESAYEVIVQQLNA